MIVVILYQIFPTKDLLLILIQRVMTLESNLNSLYYSEFSQSELSLIKLLVLSELQSYRGINGCYDSGNIHSLLLQLRQKIVVLQSKSSGSISDDSS